MSPPALYAIGTLTTALSLLVIAGAIAAIALISRKRQSKAHAMGKVGEIILDKVSRKFGAVDQVIKGGVIAV